MARNGDGSLLVKVGVAAGVIAAVAAVWALVVVLTDDDPELTRIQDRVLARLEGVETQIRVETQGPASDESGPCPPETSQSVIDAAEDYVDDLRDSLFESSTEKQYRAIWDALHPNTLNGVFKPCDFAEVPVDAPEWRDS